MRILWLSHRDIEHPRAGGAERIIYEVGRRLVGRGHDVLWVTVRWGGCGGTCEIGGVKVFRMPSNLAAHVMVPSVIRRSSPDVIVDDLAHAVPWGSERFVENPGTVFFHHLHRRSLWGQASPPVAFVLSTLEALYPIIYRRWPFVTVSETSVADLIRLGIPGGRIAKIPPGVDTDFYAPSHKTGHPSIIYFGGMRDYKRPWECLYVFREVLRRYPDARLTVVGEGPSLSIVKAIAGDLKLNRHVDFTGRLRVEELRDLLSKSWVNIHTSLTEGFGLSILEASACGVPTVAYAVPGVSETIKNGKNGILVHDGDRRALTGAVLTILDSYSNEWVKNPREIALGYSWDRTACMWEEHLIEIAS